MQKTVLVLVGPTASGKTSLSLLLADAFHAEIISADSRQCFKELNIGVAKPTLAELQKVPHHFINSHSITEPVTAASFEKFALQKVNELFEKKDVVVLVGGTGLYVKAFCEGLDQIPATDETVRNELMLRFEQRGIKWLQLELLQRDPLFAKEGEMQNPQRILRALEVFYTTGKSILTYRTGIQQQRPFRVIKIGLDMPREELYNRINQRVDVMMQAGQEQEVQQLLPFQQLNALQTVGYKELFDYFSGVYTLPTAIEKIKQNTRQYAKRQLTWFKKDKTITWFHPSQKNEIIEFIQAEIKEQEQGSGQ